MCVIMKLTIISITGSAKVEKPVEVIENLLNGIRIKLRLN